MDSSPYFSSLRLGLGLRPSWLGLSGLGLHHSFAYTADMFFLCNLWCPFGKHQFCNVTSWLLCIDRISFGTSLPICMTSCTCWHCLAVNQNWRRQLLLSTLSEQQGSGAISVISPNFRLSENCFCLKFCFENYRIWSWKLCIFGGGE